MKGTWKENLGGWNHKDSKRKKQTRKHFLNDNGRYYSMNDDCKVCRTEGEVEISSIDVLKNGTTKNIYEIRVDKYLDEYSKRFAYPYGRDIHSKYTDWYDAYTNNRIYTWGFKGISVIDIAWSEYTHFDEPRVQSRGYSYSGRGEANEIFFVHGKPYWDWERWNRLKDFPRKWAQKEVNRANRAKVRNYIKNADWDREIKFHACTKSIAWMIS